MKPEGDALLFQNLALFKTAHAMASHAATRQAVVTENVANANTPGFKARDVRPFQDTFSTFGTTAEMRQTRVSHQGHGGSALASSVVEDKSATLSPNGNSVSIEHELFKSVEAEREHSRALTIYQTSLNLLKTSIGRGR